MSYLVLARKWRPQGFDAITGQEHVTQTLMNAIAQDRVHHAFVFSGARGVGKTTAARVFARALNCRRGPGPTSEPCGTCEACTEIAQGTSLDVFEIDGASNRGINEIRELRDGVAYAPQRDRYKIYIIDEVHMLTTEAFNALLKTLEEPPRHVKFIFATTEPHKIPVTILSRCQRYDFKRIPRGVMVERLSQILDAEGIAIDADGLRMVARESEGSMRDALSLLDRIISFCGAKASYAQVAEVLGVADRSWLGRLVGAALDRNVAGALAVVEGAFDYGVDFRQFATDLVHFLRDIIVLKVAGDKAGLTDLSAEETRLLVDLGAPHGVEDLQRLATIAIKTAERLAHANFPRLELEMAVVRMCSLRPLQPIGELVRRLEGLERHLSSGAPLPAPTPFVAAHERPTATDPGAGFAIDPPPTGRLQAPAPQGPPPSPSSPVASAAGALAFDLARDAAPEPWLAPPRAETPPPPVAAPPPAPPQPSNVIPFRARAAAELPPEPAPAAPSSAAPAADRAPRDHAGFGNDDWERFVDALRPDDPSLAGALDHAEVLSLRDGVLELIFAGTNSARRTRSSESLLVEALEQRTDGIHGVLLRDDLTEELVDTPYRRRQQREERAREARRRDLEKHPLVMDVIERFGATLERIDLFTRDTPG